MSDIAKFILENGPSKLGEIFKHLYDGEVGSREYKALSEKMNADKRFRKGEAGFELTPAEYKRLTQPHWHVHPMDAYEQGYNEKFPLGFRCGWSCKYSAPGVAWGPMDLLRYAGIPPAVEQCSNLVLWREAADFSARPNNVFAAEVSQILIGTHPGEFRPRMRPRIEEIIRTARESYSDYSVHWDYYDPLMSFPVAPSWRPHWGPSLLGRTAIKLLGHSTALTLTIQEIERLYRLTNGDPAKILEISTLPNMLVDTKAVLRFLRNFSDAEIDEFWQGYKSHKWSLETGWK